MIALLLACQAAPPEPPPPVHINGASLRLPESPEAGADLAAEVLGMLQSQPVVYFQDGLVHGVVLPDTAVLSVVRRTPDTETLTGAGRRADVAGQTDVVINGMTYSFDPDAHQSGSMQATHHGAHGQALTDGVLIGGQRLKPTTARYHLLQADGRLHIGPGNPEVSGTGLSGAMALRFDSRDIGAPGGTPNRDSDRVLQVPASMGMPYTAHDPARGLLWILVREAGSAKPGRGTPETREILGHLGVAHALTWDGGPSASLIIDGDVLVQPGGYADRSIPFGLRFSVPAPP